jgi:hypothetical protein
LEKMLPPDIVKKIKTEDMAEYYFGLGMWMRNNWGLWGSSRLAKYFNQLGVYDPEAMSSIILSSFQNRLNGRPLGVEEQIAEFKQYWQAVAEPKNRRCPKDNSVITLSSKEDVTNENGRRRFIHYGVCKKRGHEWAYEFDKGWYDPNAKN